MKDNEIFNKIKDQILVALPQFSPRNQFILKQRYGLEDGRKHRLKELGKVFGISSGRIRQLEARAICKIFNQTVTYQEIFKIRNEILK